MFFIPVPTPTSKTEKKRIPKPKKQTDNKSKQTVRQVAEGALFYETINLLTPKPTDNVTILEDLTIKPPAGIANNYPEDSMLGINVASDTQTVLGTVFGDASTNDAEEAFQITWEAASQKSFEEDLGHVTYISETKTFINNKISFIKDKIKFVDAEHNFNLIRQQELKTKLAQLEIEITNNSNERHHLTEILTRFQQFRDVI